MLNSLQNSFPSFSQPYFCIQQPLQSSPKILSSTSVNFRLPIPPLHFNKITLTIPNNTPFLYAAATFHLPIFAYNHLSTPKIFSLPHPFSQFRLRQRTKQLLSFNLSLLPQSMDSGVRVHNHWFLITQPYKIGVLQVVVSDEGACNWNGKPFHPPFLISSIYIHYFHTLVTPSRLEIVSF